MSFAVVTLRLFATRGFPTTRDTNIRAFGPPWFVSLAPVHPRCSRRLRASLRTVKFLSTFSCVSLRDMKETGAASRPVPPNHSDIRRAQVLQPPDSSSDILRGSSLIAEQSPASSHRPLQGLWYHTSTPPCVSRTFSNFFGKFPAGFAPPFCGKRPPPPEMGERGRQAASFPLAPAASLCYDTQKRPLFRVHYLLK